MGHPKKRGPAGGQLPCAVENETRLLGGVGSAHMAPYYIRDKWISWKGCTKVRCLVVQSQERSNFLIFKIEGFHSSPLGTLSDPRLLIFSTTAAPCTLAKHYVSNLGAKTNLQKNMHNTLQIGFSLQVHQPEKKNTEPRFTRFKSDAVHRAGTVSAHQRDITTRT